MPDNLTLSRVTSTAAALPAVRDAHTATIQFRAKAETIYNADETVAFDQIRVPLFTRAHCDMPAFRRSRKYGGLANSDLFPGCLARIREGLGVKPYNPVLRLDRLPDGVKVDRSGFLATITITVDC